MIKSTFEFVYSYCWWFDCFSAIIAGLIIFLILLLTLFTCVSVIFTKRMCKKNDPEKVVKQEDV